MRHFIILGAILALAACGGGGGGGGGGDAGPTAATVTLQTVKLTGEVPLASGTASVTVNGAAATITGRTWVADVPYSGGDYIVRYYVDGSLVAQDEVVIQ